MTGSALDAIVGALIMFSIGDLEQRIELTKQSHSSKYCSKRSRKWSSMWVCQCSQQPVARHCIRRARLN